jgi:predicted anti-sigma-YlaC factor YlaD
MRSSGQLDSFIPPRILSVFTGIIICLISMVLTPRRIVVLVGFVVLHYIVDGALLAVSTVRTLMNVEDPAGATDTSRKKLLSYRAACWIINNLLFSIIFLVLIGVIYMIGLTRYAGVA